MRTEKTVCLGIILICIFALFACSSVIAQDPTERLSSNVEGIANVIYVIGGLTTLQGNLTAVNAYIAETGSWETKSPMSTPRSTSASAVLDDAIYVVGGRNEYSVFGILEKYSIREDKWISRESMPTPRWSLMAAAFDGKIYAFGGISGTGYNRKVLDVAEVYDPTQNEWATIGNMPQVRHSAAIAVVGDRIYVISGKFAAAPEASTEEIIITERVDCFDPVGNTWKEVKPIPTGRVGASAVVYDNRIYVVGGLDKNGGLPTVIEVYDPRSDQWSTGPKLQTGRSGHGCAILGKEIYIIGGMSIGYSSVTLCKGIDKVLIP